MEKTVEIPIGSDPFHAQVIAQSLTARGFQIELWEANATHGAEENRLIVFEQDRDAVIAFLDDI